jgi:tetratricopeptide (TPR) repeat protein
MKMSNRGRQVARSAAGIAAACLGAFLVLAVVKLMQATPSPETAQRLTIALVVSGGLSATAALSAAAVAVWQARSQSQHLPDLQAPNLMKHDRLINRSKEMKELVSRIDEPNVVNCHGPRGAGKSFLLEHLADVVNGHRRPAGGRRRPKSAKVALYFDLADAAGFEEVQAQLCRAALGEVDATWPDFVGSIKQRFKSRRVLLILDNVNSPGLWRPLGEAAYRYLASRPNDKLVFGSIDPVVLSNLDIEHMSVCGLDLDATGELVAARGVDISRSELVELHRGCNGLPLYIRLLAAFGEAVHAKPGTAVIDEQLVPELPSTSRKLLSYASLIALMNRRISYSELERCLRMRLDGELEIVERRTLMTPIPDDDGRRFKIHDVVRDTALRVLEPEVSEASLHLFNRAYEDSRPEHAALYGMFADPEEVGVGRFHELLEQVVRAAVKERNYALLGNLHSRAHEHSRILEFIAGDTGRTDLFCFARASELAGLGRYREAEDELLSSCIVRTRWGSDTEASDLQADLRFLQADVAHLLNRYDEAAQMFHELGEWAATTKRPGLRARCVWGHGHVLRHQGRDLERALNLFGQAARLADASGEVFPKVYSVTGATGIRVVMGDVPLDEEQRLADLERSIASTSAHDGHLLEIWKTQAQVAWLRGDSETAVRIVEAATERALALNDRLLYNFYFERAEYDRLLGHYLNAADGYRRVLEFGTGNGDRNLISNALLGLVLVDLSANQWLHHDSAEGARASALRARQIAADADIQITTGIADTVAAMIDSPAAATQSIRLIVL